MNVAAFTACRLIQPPHSRRVYPESSQAERLHWRSWPQFAGSGDPCSPLQRSIIGPETRVQGPTPPFLLNLQERKMDLQRSTDDQSRTGQRVTLAGGPADGWNHRLGAGCQWAGLASGSVPALAQSDRDKPCSTRRLTWNGIPTDYDVRIPAVRRQLHLSQVQLATLVGAARKAVIYQWESRKRCPSPVF